MQVLLGGYTANSSKGIYAGSLHLAQDHPSNACCGS